MAPSVFNEKFGRNYMLSLQTQSGVLLTIRPPFTVEFDITRNVLTSANVCQLRVYNLSQKNRDQIRKDVTNYGQYRPVTFQAGYQNNIPVVFTGNITVAWSVREGVNFITQIECYDGGFAFANALTNRQFNAGTPQKQVIQTLMSDLRPFGVTPGVVGNGYPNSLSRGNSYNGSTTDILSRDLTGGGFYIDNGKAYALADNEVLNGEILLINSKSGLLGTPMREQNYVDFDMIFEPRLAIGQQVRLDSISDSPTAPNFNGFYKVVMVKHRGMISEAVCGEAITSVRLLPGKPGLSVVGSP